jgi:hypothetical protein
MWSSMRIVGIGLLHAIPLACAQMTGLDKDYVESSAEPDSLGSSSGDTGGASSQVATGAGGASPGTSSSSGATQGVGGASTGTSSSTGATQGVGGAQASSGAGGAGGAGGDACFSASCDSGIQDGQESDVDCGGPCCPPCLGGATCQSDDDCSNSNCLATDHCGPFSCSNGSKNLSETDIDCGGPHCQKCAAGKACEAGADCVSGDCIALVCN